MNALVLETTVEAQWHGLITEAWKATGTPENEEMESYLVWLLMRFCGRQDVGTGPLALDYFNAQVVPPQLKLAILRDVGDKCLLISGLFPGRAERRRVKVSYYVSLGRNAYNSLSILHRNLLSHLFDKLSQDFVQLMDVLYVARNLTLESNRLSPIQAIELWSDTHSAQALRALSHYADGMPIAYSSQFRRQ